MTIYLLNSLIVPLDKRAYPVSVRQNLATVEEVRKLLKDGFVSAVGHQSTAQLLTQLLGIDVPYNRVQVEASYGDTLVHFVLKARLPEGKILTLEELKALDYYFVVSQIVPAPPR